MIACDRHLDKRDAVFKLGGEWIGTAFVRAGIDLSLESGPAPARELCEECVAELDAWLRRRV